MPATHTASTARQSVKVAVFGPNLRDQSKGQFHVHAAGCADIAKTAKRDAAYGEDYAWYMDIACKDDAVHEAYSDMIDSNDCNPIEDYRSDFYFFPCCGNLSQTNEEASAPTSELTGHSNITNLKARTALAAKMAPASFSKSPTGPRDHAKIDAAVASGLTDTKVIAKTVKLSVARVENSLAAAAKLA
jgi:hypothetical protein